MNEDPLRNKYDPEKGIYESSLVSNATVLAVFNDHTSVQGPNENIAKLYIGTINPEAGKEDGNTFGLVNGDEYFKHMDSDDDISIPLNNVLTALSDGNIEAILSGFKKQKAKI